MYTVKDVARQLHYFAPSDVFTGPRLTGHFNLGDVRQLLHALVPANLLLTVVGRETPEDVTIDSVEPWYRADYHKRPFSAEQRKAWCRAADAVATSHPDLRLCGANPFIPTSFNLHNAIVTKEKPAEALAAASVPETEVPFLLQDGKDVRVWHLPDTQFGLPKSSLRMSVVAPGAVDTPTSHALTHLYAAVVREMLVEPAYDAGTAGYHYGIGVRPGTGLTVSARGFTDKLGEVLQMVLRVMVHGKHGVSSIAPAAPFDFDDDVFARQRDKYVCSLLVVAVVVCSRRANASTGTSAVCETSPSSSRMNTLATKRCCSCMKSTTTWMICWLQRKPPPVTSCGRSCKAPCCELSLWTSWCLAMLTRRLPPAWPVSPRNLFSA